MRREELQELLLETARLVLITNGPDGATVRVITEKAGVNVASISTAFGGRDYLLDAVFARAIAPLNSERDELYAAAGPQANVDDLVRAFISPLYRVRGQETSTLQSLLHALISDARRDPYDRLSSDPGIPRFVERLHRALDDIALSAVQMRVELAIRTIGSVVASGRADVDLSVSYEALVRFVAAGLSWTQEHQPKSVV